MHAERSHSGSSRSDNGLESEKTNPWKGFWHPRGKTEGSLIKGKGQAKVTPHGVMKPSRPRVGHMDQIFLPGSLAVT